MSRTNVTDKYLLKLKPTLLDAGICDKANLRMTFEGILFRILVGSSGGIFRKDLATETLF